jgi:hypothetical protein
MQGYSKESMGRSIMIHYIGDIESSMQVNSKGSVGLSITVHYNG